jgi:hypothetical protein
VRDSASLESVRTKLTQLHAALGSAGAAAAAAASSGAHESFAKPTFSVPMPVEGEATALAGEIVELVRRAIQKKKKKKKKRNFHLPSINSLIFPFSFVLIFVLTNCHWQRQ